MTGEQLTTVYYVLSMVFGLSGAVLLLLASRRAAIPLRPWCAAAVPAALGFCVVSGLRLVTLDDEQLTGIARGITLYGIFVLYNALPFAAIHHAHLTPIVLDEFVAEIGRQLYDTGEIPVTPPSEQGGDGVA